MCDFEYVRVDVQLLTNDDDAEWNGVLEQHGPHAIAVWIALMLKAKRSKREGDVKWSSQMLGKVIHEESLQPIVETLGSLAHAGMIELVEGSFDGHFTVRIGSWGKYQTLTDTEKKRRYRAKASDDGMPVSPTNVHPSSTDVPTDGDGDGNSEGANAPVGAAPKRDSPGKVRGVFDFWCKQFGKNAAVKLDEKRRRRIRWALTHYDDATIAACIRGYAADEWRRESLVRHEIATLFRNAAQVETGLELYEKVKAGVPLRQESSGRPAPSSVSQQLRDAGWES